MNDKILIAGHHFTMGEDTRADVEAIAAKLLKHHAQIVRVRLESEHATLRSGERAYTIKGIVELRGPDLAASSTTDNLYRSVHEVVDKLERMLNERAGKARGQAEPPSRGRVSGRSSQGARLAAFRLARRRRLPSEKVPRRQDGGILRVRPLGVLDQGADPLAADALGIHLALSEEAPPLPSLGDRGPGKALDPSQLLEKRHLPGRKIGEHRNEPADPLGVQEASMGLVLNYPVPEGPRVEQ